MSYTIRDCEPVFHKHGVLLRAIGEKVCPQCGVAAQAKTNVDRDWYDANPLGRAKVIKRCQQLLHTTIAMSEKHGCLCGAKP